MPNGQKIQRERTPSRPRAVMFCYSVILVIWILVTAANRKRWSNNDLG